jgi:membrane protease YdiL (CAAX protease family)
VTILLTVILATIITHLPGLASVLRTESTALPALLALKTVNALAVLAAYLLVGRWIERRNLAQLGLPLTALPRVLAVSYTLGALFTCGIMLPLILVGSYTISALATDAGTLQTLLLELVLFFIAAVFEEVLYRAVLFRNLEDGIGTWLAMALSAVLFGLAHIVDNPNFTIVGVLVIMLVPGILLSAMFVLTRNLWWVIGFHWGFNFFEAAVFGVTVSGTNFPSLITPDISGNPLLTGGQFGPEAGIQSLILGAVVNVVLLQRIIVQRRACTPGWLTTSVRRLRGRS